ASGAGPGTGCSRAAVCFDFRPRTDGAAPSARGAAAEGDGTDRSVAAVLAERAVGSATLVELPVAPYSAPSACSPTVPCFLAFFAGRALALNSSGGKSVPSLLGGVGKGMVSLKESGRISYAIFRVFARGRCAAGPACPNQAAR